jgi:hypothetical protein
MIVIQIIFLVVTIICCVLIIRFNKAVEFSDKWFYIASTLWSPDSENREIYCQIWLRWLVIEKLRYHLNLLNQRLGLQKKN